MRFYSRHSEHLRSHLRWTSPIERMKTGPGKVSSFPHISPLAFSNQAAQKFAQTCPLALPSPVSCPFGGICHTCPPRLQAKLTVGQPGDKYEQEADRVAAEILRQPEPMAAGGPGSLAPRQPLSLMRSCTPCDEHLQRVTLEECEEPRCPAEEVEMPLLPKGLPGQTQQVSPAVEPAISGSLAGGSPLPGALRDFYEPRFGQDFRGVRLHTDAQAATAAQTMQARAFTVGEDIFFGQGQYAPDTRDGQKLLAHELTHTLQQQRVGESGSSGLVQRTLNDGHDLTSPRFKGDPILEAVYDDEDVLEQGDQNLGVEKLQHALIDAGCLLPDYGVDGDFDAETKSAVKQFQRHHEDITVTGIVESKTMGRLDLLFPPVGEITFPGGDWTVDCLLQALCLWNKPLVEQLRKTEVKILDRLYANIDRYDGTNWHTKEEDFGGVSSEEGVIGLLAKMTCPNAVDTIYHEIWHQNQPWDYSWCEMEREAFRFTAQWSTFLRLPGIPGHILFTNLNEKYFVSTTAIEETIAQYYPGICEGEVVVGKDNKDCSKVRKEGVGTCHRPPKKGDAYMIPPAQKVPTTPDKVDPTEWVCP